MGVGQEGSVTTTVQGEERPSSHARSCLGTRGKTGSWEALGQLSGLRLGPLSWILMPVALPRPR